MAHVQNHLFQDLNPLLRQNIVHACVVRQSDEQGCRGQNSIPYNRLFVVASATSDVAGQICNIGDQEQPVLMRPDKVYLMPADIDLRFEFAVGTVLAGLHFSLEIVPGIDVFRGQRQCREAPSPFVGAIAELVVALESFHDVGQLSRVKAAAMYFAGQFIDMPFAEMQALATRYRHYEPLFQILNSERLPYPSVPELAEHMGMTADTLSRHFHRDFGLPLKAFMADRVMDRAYAELLFGDLLVKEVAYNLGFNSEFYFSRFFKARAGMSPSEYRRRSLP